MLRLNSVMHHAQSKERGHHTAPRTHLTVLSLEPDTQVRPSGLMATEVTLSGCCSAARHASQSASLVSSRACGLWDDRRACRETRVLLGASHTSWSAALWPGWTGEGGSKSQWSQPCLLPNTSTVNCALLKPFAGCSKHMHVHIQACSRQEIMQVGLHSLWVPCEVGAGNAQPAHHVLYYWRGLQWSQGHEVLHHLHAKTCCNAAGRVVHARCLRVRRSLTVPR